MPDEVLGCQACNSAVSHITGPGSADYYDHLFTGERDHEVVAVLMAAADVIRRCDFCLAPHVRWMVPLMEPASTDGMFRTGEMDIRVTAVDTDAVWAACDECMPLIRERRTGALRDRAFAVLERKYAPEPVPAWQKRGVLFQLAAFWVAVPGPAEEIDA